MDKGLIVIKIKDGDPLHVEKERLTKNSNFLRHLIDELHFYEIEMDDFDPDVVALFLTHLQDNQVNEIQESQFRELHKMAVVFEVDFLKEGCRNWLFARLDSKENRHNFQEILFAFEECLYVFRKWEDKEKDMIETMISKLVVKDVSEFVSWYIKEGLENLVKGVNKLDTVQLDLLLKISGSNQMVFVNTMLYNITFQESLDDNMKFLLKNLDLQLCWSQHQFHIEQLFECIFSLRELKPEDHSFILQLCKETAESNVVFDGWKYAQLMDYCSRFSRFINAIINGGIISMFDVVDFLVLCYSCFLVHETEKESLLAAVRNGCRNMRIQKVCPQYVDMILTSLTHSTGHEYMLPNLIKILKCIREDDDLCCSRDNLLIPEETCVEEATGSKHHFFFNHPTAPECDKPGRCGFILKSSCQSREYFKFKYELCRADEDYEGTGIHFHNTFLARDMHYYFIMSGTKADGTKVTAPDRDGKGYQGKQNYFKSWLDRDVRNWVIEQVCIQYNLADYNSINKI